MRYTNPSRSGRFSVVCIPTLGQGKSGIRSLKTDTGGLAPPFFGMGGQQAFQVELFGQAPSFRGGQFNGVTGGIAEV